MIKQIFIVSSVLCLFPIMATAQGSTPASIEKLTLDQRNNYDRFVKIIEDAQADFDQKDAALQQSAYLPEVHHLDVVRKAFLQPDDDLAAEAAVMLIRNSSSSLPSNLEFVKSNIDKVSQMAQCDVLEDFANRSDVQAKAVEMLFHDIAKKVLLSPVKEMPKTGFDSGDAISDTDALSYACLVVSLSPSYNANSDSPALLKAANLTKAPGRVALALSYRKLLTVSLYRILLAKKADTLSQKQAMLVAGSVVSSSAKNNLISILQTIVRKNYAVPSNSSGTQIYLDEHYIYMLRFVDFSEKKIFLSQAARSPSIQIRKAALLLSVNSNPSLVLNKSNLALFDDISLPSSEGNFLLTYLSIKNPSYKSQVYKILSSKMSYYTQQIRRGGISAFYGETPGFSGSGP